MQCCIYKRQVGYIQAWFAFVYLETHNISFKQLKLQTFKNKLRRILPFSLNGWNLSPLRCLNMWLCVLLGFERCKDMGLGGHRLSILEAARKREPKSSSACELAWVFVKKTSHRSPHSIPLGVSSRQVVLGLCGLAFSLFQSSQF